MKVLLKTSIYFKEMKVLLTQLLSMYLLIQMGAMSSSMMKQWALHS